MAALAKQTGHLRLKLGATWFYIGLLIHLLGLIMYTIVWVKFATTPLDEPVTMIYIIIQDIPRAYNVPLAKRRVVPPEFWKV